MNKLRWKKQRPLHLVLDLIIGVLCVFAIFTVIVTIREINDAWNYSYDVDAFYYRLQDEDFATMVEMYYTNKESGVKGDQELQQYYGIAEYFEAASYYKAYQEQGDLEQMEKYFNKMEAAKAKMGQLRVAGDLICQKLELVN